VRRHDFIAGIAGSAAAWPLAARGQQGPRPARLGYFAPASNPDLLQTMLGAPSVFKSDIGIDQLMSALCQKRL